MRDEQAKELLRQLSEGNGHESDATRGMTLRELVLELREQQKDYPTRKEVYTVVGVLSAIVTAFAASSF